LPGKLAAIEPYLMSINLDSLVKTGSQNSRNGSLELFLDQRMSKYLKYWTKRNSFDHFFFFFFFLILYKL
jgi:hypothetical protein